MRWGNLPWQRANLAIPRRKSVVLVLFTGLMQDQRITRGFKRRDLLAGSVAAGAALVLPGRALARGHRAAHHAGGPHAPGHHAHADHHAPPHHAAAAPAPAPTEAPTVAAEANPLTPYQRKVVDIATREADRASAVLWQKDRVGVADFALSSASPRLHIVNLESGTLTSFLVAHGRGSDPEHDGWLKSFSNAVGSEATSRGAYLTGSWYDGKYGTSIRLTGMDADNSNAMDRAIVMHPAWYAAPDMLAKWGKLGRSEGCFAMAPEQFNEALWHLAAGRLLFADRIGEV